MKLIESTTISKMCDYSFGDQAGYIHNLFNKFMSPANINNYDFIKKYEQLKKNNIKVMTLFIDNIRLYKRDIQVTNSYDKQKIDEYYLTNDLLEACSKLSDMNFIIFTGHEDTPIDYFIEGKIPKNVIAIYAVNAIYNNDKIKPFPYGIQRQLYPNDNRIDYITNIINNGNNIIPTKLLYINHSIQTNFQERNGINELFINKTWATVDTKKLEYKDFLNKILNHKFMICPIGNAIDCHRNWEVLYLKRVPIMKYNEYLVKLFKDFPVLYVNNYKDINEELLIKNNVLYNEVQNLNMYKLDLDKIFYKLINNE
jgi:hypothetical protein